MAKRVKIPGRLESAETGNIVTGADAVMDDEKGKTQVVINSEVDAAIINLAQGKQDNLTFDSAPTEDSHNPVTSAGVYTADKVLSDAIEAILLLIPSAASALNKLVDMQTMNSSIATATASFKGTYNLVSDLHLGVDATHEQIGAALDALSLGADNNDYAFVQVPNSATAPTEINKTERYKYNGTNWLFEYDLNNSGFTQGQWNAINSGVTSLLVGKLSDLPTNAELTTLLAGKQDNLTFDNVPTAGSPNPVKSGGVYARNNEIVALINALDAAKQDVLTFDNAPVEGSPNPVKSGGVYTAISAVQAAIVALDAAKQDVLTFDSTPTLGSANPVMSSGIKTELNRIDGNITTLNDLYEALTQSALVIVQPSDTWPVANPATSTIYRVVDRTNTPPQNYSDYMWNGSAMVLMATYDNAIDDEPTAGSNNLVKGGGVFNSFNTIIANNETSFNKYITYIRNIFVIPQNQSEHEFFNEIDKVDLRYLGVRVSQVGGAGSIFGIQLFADNDNYGTFSIHSVPDISSCDIVELPVINGATGHFTEGIRVFVEFNGRIDFSQSSGLISLYGTGTYVKLLNSSQLSMFKKIISQETVSINNITGLETIINLFDKNTVVADSYVKYNTGEIGSLAGYYASDYIPVIPGETYIYQNFLGTRGIQQLAFYNSNKEYVSGLVNGMYGFVRFTCPVNCYYVRLTIVPNGLDYAQLYRGENILPYSPHKEYIDPSLINIPLVLNEMKPEVTVGPNGADYTSLLKALKETSPNTKIHLLGGTVNVVREYKDYYGDDFFDNYTGYENQADDFYKGLWLDYGRQIEGESNSIIEFNYTGNNGNVKSKFSILAVCGNNRVSNIKLVETVAQSVEYLIHDDFSNHGKSGHIEYNNIVFQGTGTLLGGGFGINMSYRLSNCVFINQKEDERLDAFYHGSTNSGSSTSQCKVTVSNCYFTNNLAFQWLGVSTRVSEIYVNNCKAHSITCKRHLGEGQETSNVNMAMLKYNCEEEVVGDNDNPITPLV